MNFDVIIIGGGVHGCATALHLSEAKLRVLVLERAAVARHASGASAGGVRTLGRDLAEVPLSLIAANMWARIDALVDDDCGFHAHGQLKVAEDEHQFAALTARRQSMVSRGYTHEVLIDQAELRRRAPAIGQQCIGALMVERDGAANPHQTTHAFRRAAERLGAQVVEGAGVIALRREAAAWRVMTASQRYDAPFIVNCAGAWGDDIAAMAGDHLPIVTRCSMMSVTERLPHFLDPVVGAVGRTLSFKQTADGTVVIGGGEQGRPDRERESYELDAGGLARNVAAAVAIFPLIRHARIVRSWAGLEAQTPDRLPIIGQSSLVPGLFHAVGFSGHGFQLGPVVGRAIADLIVAGATQLPISAFAPQRFFAPGKAA